MQSIVKINLDQTTSVVSKVIPDDVTGIAYSPKEKAVAFFKVSTGVVGFIYDDGKVVTVPRRLEVDHPIAMCCDQWGIVLMQASPEMLWCFNQSLDSGERMCGRRAFEDSKSVLPQNPLWASQCAICRLDRTDVVFTAPWANKVVEVHNGVRNDYAGSGRRGFSLSSNPKMSMFDFPSGICYDTSTGTLFVSDTSNSVVRGFRNRKEIGCVGTPRQSGHADGRFEQPTSLCVSGGLISVADDMTVSQFNSKTLLPSVVYTSDKKVVSLAAGEKCVYTLEKE